MLTQSLLLLERISGRNKQRKTCTYIISQQQFKLLQITPQKNPHTAQEVLQRKQNLFEIQFNFIDCSRITLQGKFWYMSDKDFFGNKQINSHNIVITYTLTCSQQSLWNICNSCRNTAELQLLINSQWFLIFFFRHRSLFDIMIKPGTNSKGILKKIQNSALELWGGGKKAADSDK